MASTLIQFRTDDVSKAQASLICAKLGIDLQVYLRMCMTRLIQENGVPFSMRVDDIKNKGIAALKRSSERAIESGVADMSLDEINAEIDAARAERYGE